MNKEEIEESKKSLNERIQNTYAERKAIKLDNLRKYIQHLEQKSEKLDKVTELATKIATENAEKYNSENQKEVDFSEWNLALEILNIIEGEREYCCTCGVELNSKNKALNNMCNECKYGLDYQKESEEK